MKKILKFDAFELVVDAMEKNDYKTANDILAIINKPINNKKTRKFFSKEIELTKREEKIFRKYTKI